MYNNCALIGGIICLADVFLLGADSQTDKSTRFVKLCQVNYFDVHRRNLFCLLGERFIISRWIFYMLRWFIS